MNKFLKKNIYSKLSFVIILIYSLVYLKINCLDNGRWKYIISGDGLGYYAYLPAAFIYHDFTFKFVNAADKELNKEVGVPPDFFMKEVDHEKVNKYFAGVALLLMPFFFAACILSYLFNFPVDGYSLPFQLSVFFASVFYLLLGLYYVKKLLDNYNISDRIIAFTMIAFALGTNLMNYYLHEPSLSHVYSFSLIAMFCYYSKIITVDFKNKHLYFLFVIISLIIICRPVNGIVLLSFPFFSISFHSFILTVKKILSKKRILIFGLLTLLLIIFIQSLAYYIQTGKWFVYGYKEEHLDFLKPQLETVLWSYRKGLFIYTPLVFLSLFGFYYLFKQNIFNAIVLFLFLFIVAYVISCWTNPIYGYGFGLRAFIEFYPFFMILFAFLLSNSLLGFNIAWVIITCCAIVLNNIQNYQYINIILHGENMDKIKYWKIFLKTDKKYMGVLSRNYGDIIPEDEILSTKTFFNNFDSDEDWGNKDSYSKDYQYSGKYSSKVFRPDYYSPGFDIKLSEFSDSLPVYIFVSCQSYLTSENCYPELIISFENPQGGYSYNSFPVYFRADKIDDWCETKCGIRFPDQRKSKDDIVKVYIVNNSKKPYYMDDFKIEIKTLKKNY